MILSNDGLVAFHCRTYGTFFLQQKRLHNSYSGFTHYKNYRAKKATANPLLFLEIRDYCPRLYGGTEIMEKNQSKIFISL